MTLTLDIPDFVVPSMQLTECRVLEVIALHSYRQREYPGVRWARCSE